jgi:hypothetical protein
MKPCTPGSYGMLRTIPCSILFEFRVLQVLPQRLEATMTVVLHDGMNGMPTTLHNLLVFRVACAGDVGFLSP